MKFETNRPESSKHFNQFTFGHSKIVKKSVTPDNLSNDETLFNTSKSNFLVEGCEFFVTDVTSNFWAISA